MGEPLYKRGTFCWGNIWGTSGVWGDRWETFLNTSGAKVWGDFGTYLYANLWETSGRISGGTFGGMSGGKFG